MISEKVKQFMEALGKADAITANSPLLTHWDTADLTGEPDNEVVHLSWVDDDGNTYRCILTEGGIADGTWTDEAFCCYDSEGDTVSITMCRFQPLVVPSLGQQSSSAQETDLFYDQLVEKFSGFLEDGDVNGADLVDFIANNLELIRMESLRSKAFAGDFVPEDGVECNEARTGRRR